MSTYEGSAKQQQNEDSAKRKVTMEAATIPPRPPEVTLKSDAVNHPKHYNDHPSGIECITIVEGFNFNVGNAVKYLWRSGLKPSADHIEDLKKAIWYINREIQRLESGAKGNKRT